MFVINLFSNILYIAHLHDISSFLTDATEALIVRPQTVDEIGEDNLKYGNLQEKKAEVGFYLIIVRKISRQKVQSCFSMPEQNTFQSIISRVCYNSLLLLLLMFFLLLPCVFCQLLYVTTPHLHSKFKSEWFPRTFRLW